MSERLLYLTDACSLNKLVSKEKMEKKTKIENSCCSKLSDSLTSQLIRSLFRRRKLVLLHRADCLAVEDRAILIRHQRARRVGMVAVGVGKGGGGGCAKAEGYFTPRWVARALFLHGAWCKLHACLYHNPSS